MSSPLRNVASTKRPFIGENMLHVSLHVDQGIQALTGLFQTGRKVHVGDVGFSKILPSVLQDCSWIHSSHIGTLTGTWPVTHLSLVAEFCGKLMECSCSTQSVPWSQVLCVHSSTVWCRDTKQPFVRLWWVHFKLTWGMQLPLTSEMLLTKSTRQTFQTFTSVIMLRKVVIYILTADRSRYMTTEERPIQPRAEVILSKNQWDPHTSGPPWAKFFLPYDLRSRSFPAEPSGKTQF